MHLEQYIQQVHEQLRAAAALGDERTQQVAAALAGTADAAVRLAVLAAVSDAAGEISTALLDTNDGPTVSVALDGDEIRVDIGPTGAPQPPSQPPPDEGDATARI